MRPIRVLGDEGLFPELMARAVTRTRGARKGSVCDKNRALGGSSLHFAKGLVVDAPVMSVPSPGPESEENRVPAGDSNGTDAAESEATAAEAPPDGGDAGSEGSEESGAPTEIHSKVERALPPMSQEERALFLARMSRALCVLALIGMGLCTWAWLAFHAELREALLEKNELEGPVRVSFLIQLAVSGGVGMALGLGALGFQRPTTTEGQLVRAAGVEAWAWFLGPLMLTPAAIVFAQHQVWFNEHKTLLPIVLFFGLIAEVLFYQCLTNVPLQVRQFFGGDSPIKNEVPLALRRHGLFGLVVFLGLAYGLFMSIVTVRWHHMMGTATFDLGINNNLIYGGLHGKFNQSTVIFPDEPAKYIANHVKLGLYLFLPIYAVFPRPETLLVIQSIILGLGAIPLFLFARRRIPEWTAVVVTVAYLCYYPMHGANFTEMNLVPLAAPFIMGLVWALDTERYRTAWVLFFVCLIMREDIPLPLAVLGLFFVLSGYRPRAGLVIFGISASWFIILRFKIMTDAGSWWFPNMYEDLWALPFKGFGGVIHTLLTNPTFVLKHIFVEKKLWYILHLMTPLLFLPARRWYLWAAFIPGAIITLLVTSYDPPLMFSFQYVMHWGPYIFLTAVLAIAALGRDAQKISGSGAARQGAAAIAVGLASLALTYNYGAFPERDGSLSAGYHKIRFHLTPGDIEKLGHVRAVEKMIPSSATVATTERLGAHLSSRLGFFTLRRGHHDVDYIVAEKSGLRLDRTKQSILDGLVSGDYGVLARQGPFIVFKRGEDTEENEEVISEWNLRSKSKSRRSRDPEPEQEPEAEGGSEAEADSSAEDEPSSASH